MAEHNIIKPFDGFNTFNNLLMGTGPILLPPAIAAAGIILGGLWLVLMLFFSSMGAEFVVEVKFINNKTLSITNAINQNSSGDPEKEKCLVDVNNYSNDSEGI